MENPEKTTNKQEKIIITGGTEGIGKAITIELAKQNHDIVICARTQKRLDEMKNESGIKTVQIDLGDTDKIKDFINKSIAKLNGLNILILNAGITGLKESEDYTFKVNETANIILIKTAMKSLRKNKGTIIFITSEIAHTNFNGKMKPYRESKLHMEQWLHDLSMQPENNNIKIFSINPQSVNTRMHQEVIKYGTGEIKKRTETKINNNQLRDPIIIGKIIANMALTKNKYNPETNQYDSPILNNEIVAISDENIDFETKRPVA